MEGRVNVEGNLKISNFVYLSNLSMKMQGEKHGFEGEQNGGPPDAQESLVKMSGQYARMSPLTSLQLIFSKY